MVCSFVWVSELNCFPLFAVLTSYSESEFHLHAGLSQVAVAYPRVLKIHAAHMFLLVSEMCSLCFLTDERLPSTRPWPAPDPELRGTSARATVLMRRLELSLRYAPERNSVNGK